MTHFWIYFFSYLFVLAVGVVIGMLIDKDNTYKVTIRKIKQRGRGNTLESELDVNLTPKTKSGGVLSKWRQKRNEKKDKKAKKRL